MSLTMLPATPAGDGYRAAERRAWMREAGFRRARVAPPAGRDSIAIGVG